MGIGLILGADWTVRFIALFPVMALVTAVGIRYPLQMLVKSQRYLLPVVAVITSALIVGQVVYYWGQHLPAYNVQLRAGIIYDPFDVIERVLKATPNGQ